MNRVLSIFALALVFVAVFIATAHCHRHRQRHHHHHHKHGHHRHPHHKHHHHRHSHHSHAHSLSHHRDAHSPRFYDAVTLLKRQNAKYCFYSDDHPPHLVLSSSSVSDSHSHSHTHSHSHPHSHPSSPFKTLALRLSDSLRVVLQPLEQLSVEKAAMTASLLTSCVSLISVLLLPFIDAVHRILLPFSAGALASDLIYHLLPHMFASTSTSSSTSTSTLFLYSLCVFAFMDMILRRLSPSHSHSHSHSNSNSSTCTTTAVNTNTTTMSNAYINLLADALHNFCDGLTLASAFLISSSTGISTTLAIILHELPQEMADFTLLLRAGMSPRVAIFANLCCACTALLGTYTALRLVAVNSGNAQALTMPIAAGALTYMTFVSVVPDAVEQVVSMSKDKPLSKFVMNVATALAAAAAGALTVAAIEAVHEH